MKHYRLVDIKLGVACNTPSRPMTAEAALALNRDLLLAGQKNIGWLVASRVDDKGRVK